MELAEKSLGDLLRRLPIIMLEDSTLHPDFPFLVWLMVAESKVCTTLFLTKTFYWLLKVPIITYLLPLEF
jgi:hypothetical protein